MLFSHVLTRDLQTGGASRCINLISVQLILHLPISRLEDGVICVLDQDNLLLQCTMRYWLRSLARLSGSPAALNYYFFWQVKWLLCMYFSCSLKFRFHVLCCFSVQYILAIELSNDINIIISLPVYLRRAAMSCR